MLDRIKDYIKRIGTNRRNYGFGLIVLAVILILTLFLPSGRVASAETEYSYNGLYSVVRTLDIDIFNSGKDYNQPFPFVMVVLAYPTLLALIVLLADIVVCAVKLALNKPIRFFWELLVTGFICLISLGIALTVSWFSGLGISQTLGNGFTVKIGSIQMLLPFLLIGVACVSKVMVDGEKKADENAASIEGNPIRIDAMNTIKKTENNVPPNVDRESAEVFVPDDGKNIAEESGDKPSNGATIDEIDEK
ncbi:MAG: hypothetical protein PHX51_03990 [Clostridia bacterium]|nr:hypothetical protein [Clostridia bacterium]